MRDLLSIQSIRHLALLEYLMDTPRATLTEVSEATGYASRTLWQDVQELNTYLQPICIETTNSGLSLNIPQGFSIRAIYQLLLAQSKEYSLLEYLFLNEGEVLEKLADSLYLSLSTLRRMITELNKKLEKYQVKIAVAPTRVIGDELSVSQFYIAFFSEKYYNLSDFLPYGEFQTLNLLLRKICEENAWELSFPDLQKLRIWGYIRLIRMRYGHMIHYENALEAFHDYTFLHDQAFLTQFFATFRMTMNKDLLLQMFQVVLGGLHVATYEDLMSSIKKDSSKKEIFDHVFILLSGLSKEFDLSLSGTEKLQVDLYNIIQLSSYRHFIIYSRSQQFLDGFARDSKNVLDIFYKKVEEYDFCSRVPGRYICNDLIYTIITEWPEFLEKIESVIPEVEIGLLFDTDISHLHFIQKILKKYSKQKLSIVVPDVFSTISGKLPSHGLDLLITDIPNLPISDVEILCVQEYPSPKDWQKILEAQERIVSKKMKTLSGLPNK